MIEFPLSLELQLGRLKEGLVRFLHGCHAGSWWSFGPRDTGRAKVPGTRCYSRTAWDRKAWCAFSAVICQWNFEYAGEQCASGPLGHHCSCSCLCQWNLDRFAKKNCSRVSAFFFESASRSRCDKDWTMSWVMLVTFSSKTLGFSCTLWICSCAGRLWQMCSFFLGAKSCIESIFNPFFVLLQSILLSLLFSFLCCLVSVFWQKIGFWFLFLTSSQLKDWAVVHVLQSSFWCRKLCVGRLFVHFEKQYVLHLFSENCVNTAQTVDSTYMERDTLVLVLSLFTMRYMVADLFSLRDSCWNTVYAAEISNNTDLGVCASSPRCCSNCRGVYNLVSSWFSFWCLVSIHQRVLCCTADYGTSSRCWCDLRPCEFPHDLRGSFPFEGRD